MSLSPRGEDLVWPRLPPYDEWADTCQTLHLWTQILGKLKLTLAPEMNHWWHVTLAVTPRGISTGSIPFGTRVFEMELDLHHHLLRIDTSEGLTRTLPLEGRPVAAFYDDVAVALSTIGLWPEIWTVPVEVDDHTPLDEDTHHGAYDPAMAHRYWRALLQVDRVFRDFRARFLGKASPVHFFWGAFDLAVTRFSGRLAPEHPGAPNLADHVVKEAYSHECSSAGFWPGGLGVAEAQFYSYVYPEPEGFSRWRVAPAEASYDETLREFVLPYEAVRRTKDPDGVLLSFLESTYEAAAELGRWDRAVLERGGGKRRQLVHHWSELSAPPRH